jgi:6-phosphogluconolactonase
VSTEHRFASREELAESLAATVAASLEEAIAERGIASLVVSGGTTPLPFFRALRVRPLPWQHVVVTLADDRWVPATHERSNEALVRRELLAEAAAAARFVALVSDRPTPEAGLLVAEQRIAEVPRPFDAVVLGMGTDGHTASLFPGAAGARAALHPRSSARCAAIRPAGGLEPRISLTLAALIDSRRLFLHLTGEDKWRVYRASVTASARQLPVGALLRHARTAVAVHWAP